MTEALRVELLALLELLHGELLALVRRGELVAQRRHAVRWNDQSCKTEHKRTVNAGTARPFSDIAVRTT